MDHHHWDVAVAALPNHVPYVHLVDADMARGTETAQLDVGLFDLLAAHEEAALCLQHQGRLRRLKISKILGHCRDRRSEEAHECATDQNGRLE
jgi:hypothetical protein